MYCPNISPDSVSSVVTVSAGTIATSCCLVATPHSLPTVGTDVRDSTGDIDSGSSSLVVIVKAKGVPATDGW